jgi:hypothetical protein
MSNNINKLKILTNKNDSDNSMNFINRQLTVNSKIHGILRNSIINEKNINNIKINKKVKINERKALPDFISKFEKKISDSLFDGYINTIKRQSSFGHSRYFRNRTDFRLTKKDLKPLVYYIPKHIEYKLIFDIIFGHFYFLSKNSGDLKKIKNFILEIQNKFNKKCGNIFLKNENNNNNSQLIKTEPKKTYENNSNGKKYYDILDKIKYYHKLEDLMSLYCLILLYLIKNNYHDKAKIIFLIMIKQNINYINYLEQLIDYKILLKEKNNKLMLKLFQLATISLLKIYSPLIKYSFLLHLSYYGNMFMKKYFNLSYQIYLYSISCHKMKIAITDNENQANYWFSKLNYYATYFSISNYLSMKIPISLCNFIIQIYNGIDNKFFDLKEKNLLLCTYYNKSLLLYVNGHSQEAINCLNEGKKKLFIYIEEYLYDNDKNVLK